MLCAKKRKVLLRRDVCAEFSIGHFAGNEADHLFAIDYDPSKKADSTIKGSTIFEFDSSLYPKNHFGATGSTDRTTCWFHDIAIDSKGNLYAGDIIGLKVLKFSPQK